MSLLVLIIEFQEKYLFVTQSATYTVEKAALSTRSIHTLLLHYTVQYIGHIS